MNLTTCLNKFDTKLNTPITWTKGKAIDVANAMTKTKARTLGVGAVMGAIGLGQLTMMGKASGVLSTNYNPSDNPYTNLLGDK